MIEVTNLHYVALISVLPVVHFLVVARHRGVLNADGLLVLSQWAMAAGTLSILDLSLAVARTYAWVVSIPLLIYVITSMLIFWATPQLGPAKSSLEPIRRGGRLTVRVWFIVSLGVTLVYYIAVGYNVLVVGVHDMFSRSTSDYTELRMQSYSADRYLFPGYVNQFKNILLPSFALVLIHSTVTRYTTFKWVKVAMLTLVSILALLGTGQRGAFIVFCITLVTFIRVAWPEKSWRRIAGVSILAVPVILLVTLLLGRSGQQVDSAGSPFAAVLVLIDELQKRIFYDNQFSGWVAFRYLAVKPTQWGGEWGDGVLGVLPGHSGSSLAREVFAFMYGSDRGTAPVSMWGSVFYNWSWGGILLLPVLLAFISARLVRSFKAVESPTALEAVGYAGSSAVLGNWIVGGPEFLLNAGLLAFLFVWWLGRRIRRTTERDERRRGASRRPGPTSPPPRARPGPGPPYDSASVGELNRPGESGESFRRKDPSHGTSLEVPDRTA